MSCAELFEPMTTQLASVSLSGRELARMALLAAEAVHAWKLWNLRHARHASRQYQLLRPQRDPLPAAVDGDSPLLARLVEPCALAFSRCPDVELHDLSIHLQPVAHLVLGREHRPMVRERQVRHVVVPNGVVQAERLVAVAPAVAGSGILLDNDGGHGKPLEARSKR